MTRKEIIAKLDSLPKTRDGRCIKCFTAYERAGVTDPSEFNHSGFGMAFVYCPKCSPQEDER